MAGQIVVQRGAGSTGGGGGTPGGANTQVQYNDGGAFGGDAGLTFDEATDILTAVGGVDIDSDTGLLRLGASQDVVLARDAADILALRRSTNPQRMRIYGTFTDSSNYERYVGGYDSSEVAFVFKTEVAGTGVAGNASLVFRSARDIALFPASGRPINFRNSWTIGQYSGSEPDGSLVPSSTTNTLDLGSDANLIRDIRQGRWHRWTSTSTDPTAGTAPNLATTDMAVYRKSSKFVIAYNNGGTMTFITIPLDGSTTTWTHNTTAP